VRGKKDGKSKNERKDMEKKKGKRRERLWKGKRVIKEESAEKIECLRDSARCSRTIPRTKQL
jgi:hypothetical protein